MPNTIQVTGDDEPFLIQMDMLDTSLSAVREELNKVSLTSICLDCGDPIGAARKKAVPSSTRCIDCQEYSNAKNAKR